MTYELIAFAADNRYLINFISHLIIFIGGLYVALHSRTIPRWLSTLLWYVGCASMLCALTIGLEWTFGAVFPLSYSQLGFLCEIFLHVSIAVTVATLFSQTLWNDIVKYRSQSGSSDHL